MMVDEGATEVTSSHMIGAEFRGGKTTHIDLGGTGRPVVGKLLPPEGFKDKVRWNFALIHVTSDEAETRPPIGYWKATVDRDGKFRIDDMPAGNYSLNVLFRRDEAGALQNHRFKVPSSEDDRAEQPVDLGELRLKNR